MEGEEGSINQSTGQKRDYESSGHDGSAPAQKQAAHQCRFCSEPAERTSKGHEVEARDAPTDLGPEELAVLLARTGGGGDEQSAYCCTSCEGKIRRIREATKKAETAAKKSASKKPAKKVRKGGSAPLGELPTNPATRSSGAKDTQSPPEKQAPSSSCASSLTVAGHR